MSRNIIVYITIASALAMIVLVGLQMIWIRNAIRIKEVNFRQGVTNSLTNVVYKLEKIEASKRLDHRLSRMKKGYSLLHSIDSINNAFLKGIDTSRYSVNREVSDTLIDGPDGPVRVRMLSQGYTRTLYSQRQSRADTNSRIEAELDYGRRHDSVQSVRNVKRIDQIEHFLQKSFVLTDLFDDYFSYRPLQAVEDRINPEVLDSMLFIELSNQGITTEMEWGILSPWRKSLVLQRTGKYTSELLQSSYALNLFPSDLYTEPEYLLVYFPDEKVYLLRQMGGMMVVSVVLILLIFFLFVYTILMLIRQKNLSEMKSDLINNMTHEFKTPVATVALVCEALKDEDMLKSQEVVSSYLDIIREENKRLENMAEKILQTALMEKGELVLKMESVDIHDILTDAVRYYQFQIEMKDGYIRTDFKAVATEVIADRAHLSNVFSNLFDNAIKYCQQKPVIHVKTESDESGIAIAVSDNGIGISKANQKRVFEKLYRVPTGNVHNAKGFGLGLSYVKAIVEKHGGNVHLDSELHKGSTFRIYLPFSK